MDSTRAEWRPACHMCAAEPMHISTNGGGKVKYSFLPVWPWMTHRWTLMIWNWSVQVQNGILQCRHEEICREESRCSERDAFHADTLDELVLHHAVPPWTSVNGANYDPMLCNNVTRPLFKTMWPPPPSGQSDISSHPGFAARLAGTSLHILHTHQ